MENHLPLISYPPTTMPTLKHMTEDKSVRVLSEETVEYMNHLYKRNLKDAPYQDRTMMAFIEDGKYENAHESLMNAKNEPHPEAIAGIFPYHRKLGSKRVPLVQYTTGRARL